ncbi:MAG TPA: hypothetical protein VGH56_10620 [Solirubrobacteraceae bacterium]
MRVEQALEALGSRTFPLLRSRPERLAAIASNSLPKGRVVAMSPLAAANRYERRVANADDHQPRRRNEI